MKSALALMALGAAALPAAAIAQTNVTIAETAPVVTLNVTETVEATPDQATVGTGGFLLLEPLGSVKASGLLYT